MNDFSENSNSNLTLGQKLKQTREEANLRQEDVAQRLFLSKKIINALENDDYSNIAAPTYARGYLRSYAQLLMLSDVEILKAFDKLKPAFTDPGKPVSECDICKDQKVAINSKTMHIFTLLTIATLVLLVLIWSFSHRSTVDIKNIVVKEADKTQVSTEVAQPETEPLKIALPVNTDAEAKPEPVNNVKKPASSSNKQSKSNHNPVIVDHSVNSNDTNPKD